MSEHTTADIRNLALVGHGGAGKTTLVEALLFRAGAIGAAGSVAKGTTVCDHDSQEKEQQNSLMSALARIEREGKTVNLIDTPGYPDFMGRSVTVLPAVESAVVVIDARAGIQPSTRRMFEAAGEEGLCRVIVINKIDADDIDLQGLLAEVAASFGAECLPLNLPAEGATSVVDCFFDASPRDTDFSSVDEAHTRLVDQVVELDEGLMELYLEQGEELAPERLHQAFAQALGEGHLVPVCFVSAETGAGIDQLLELVVRLLPSPASGKRREFRRGSGEEAETVTFEPDADAPVIAHVFKVTVDPFVGKLGVFRIHRGRVTKDTPLYAGEQRKPFKVGHLFQLQGKEHLEIEAAIPGDLCAVAKVDEVSFDAVLCESPDDVGLEVVPAARPAPMFGLAIDAATHGDEQKLSDGLQKLAAEDPCFLVEHHASTNETVVLGLSDQHLRLMLAKLAERYNVEVNTRPPKIPYRETIRQPAEGHHRHKKQTGGAGQFGEVYLRIEPLRRGSGFEFVDKIVGGVIPQQYIPAIEKGVRQVLQGGAIAGYEMQDVRVTVYDGKFHPVDSKEVAFITAGKKAFIDAVNKAAPVLLEPIVDIQVTVPQHYMGDITGDLSGKRGRISGTDTLPGGMLSVSGQVPLSELGSYQSELKSVTGGTGSYTMNFSHYDPVPAQIQQQLMAEFQPAADDD